MKKVRITILKTTLDEKLAREFGMIGLGPCPLMKAGEVYYADWIRKPGVAIVSCNDGLRPVIMKLEATDIPSEPPKPAESREQSIEFRKQV